MKYYRTLDATPANYFEGTIYTDKQQAIDDCISEWNALSEHDKKLRSCFYVAEYDTMEDAEIGWDNHNCVYDAMKEE